MLAAFPEHCVPVLQWAFEESDSLAIGTKLELLAAMTHAAYALSEIPPPADEDPKLKANAGSLSTAEKAVGHSMMQPSKTMVRRPRRLALLKRQSTRFTNKFIPIAPSFAKPVLVALQRFLNSDYRIQELKGDRECGDGVDTLLPSQCLLTLAAFTRCTVNHNIRFQIADQILQLAIELRDSSSLSVRRAVTAAMHAGVEVLFDQNSLQSNDTARTDGVLESLTNIVSLSADGGSAYRSSVLSRAGEIVDWCMKTYPADADDLCRQVKVEIIKMAVRALGGS